MSIIPAVLHWGLLITMAKRIVPPKVPSLSLPADVLENIRLAPGFYMPGQALTGLVQARKLARMAADGTSQLADRVRAVLPVLVMRYSVPSGAYLYRLKYKDQFSVHKLLVLI